MSALNQQPLVLARYSSAQKADNSPLLLPNRRAWVALKDTDYHCVCQRDLLEDIKPFLATKTILGGKVAEIKECGTVKIGNITLTDVLYDPDGLSNVISLPRASNAGLIAPDPAQWLLHWVTGRELLQLRKEDCGFFTLRNSGANECLFPPGTKRTER